MEKRSALLGFTIRVKASWLHKLCQALVERAYEAGYEDAKAGKPMESRRVYIDPSQIRKLQP